MNRVVATDKFWKADRNWYRPRLENGSGSQEPWEFESPAFRHISSIWRMQPAWSWHLFGKQATGEIRSGFDSPFLRQIVLSHRSSVGRALAYEAGCHKFDPCRWVHSMRRIRRTYRSPLTEIYTGIRHVPHHLHRRVGQWQVACFGNKISQVRFLALRPLYSSFSGGVGRVVMAFAC